MQVVPGNAEQSPMHNPEPSMPHEGGSQTHPPVDVSAQRSNPGQKPSWQMAVAGSAAHGTSASKQSHTLLRVTRQSWPGGQMPLHTPVASGVAPGQPWSTGKQSQLLARPNSQTPIVPSGRSQSPRQAPPRSPRSADPGRAPAAGAPLRDRHPPKPAELRGRPVALGGLARRGRGHG